MKPTKLKEHVLASVHPRHASDSLEVYQTKKEHVLKKKPVHLPKLGFVTPRKPCLGASQCSTIKTQIREHLDVLENSFGNYFVSTLSKSEIRLRNPFLVDINAINDPDLVKDELIGLRSKDIVARHDFQKRKKSNRISVFADEGLYRELYPGQCHF